MSKDDARVGADARPENGWAGNPIDSVSNTLDECRTRIDDLLVQLDVVKLNVRDKADRQVARRRSNSPRPRANLHRGPCRREQGA